MGKSTSVKREIRFQQWIQQVKEYNERPDGMSMSAWCKTRGIAQSTFATRLQKVQDRCLESCQISAESSELSVLSEPAMPAFVELPVATYSCKDKPAAVISCPNFKIEISESVSEMLFPFFFLPILLCYKQFFFISNPCFCPWFICPANTERHIYLFIC